MQGISSERQTDRIALNLIRSLSDPIWRYVFMNLLTVTIDHLSSNTRRNSRVDFQASFKDCKPILYYLLKKALPQVPKKGRNLIIENSRDGIVKVLNGLLSRKGSSQSSQIEKIKILFRKYALYNRVTMAFRKATMVLPDDQVFWSTYLLMYLNKKIDRELVQSDRQVSPRIKGIVNYYFVKWQKNDQSFANIHREHTIHSLLKFCDKYLVQEIIQTKFEQQEIEFENFWEMIHEAMNRPKEEEKKHTNNLDEYVLVSPQPSYILNPL